MSTWKIERTQHWTVEASDLASAFPQEWKEAAERGLSEDDFAKETLLELGVHELDSYASGEIDDWDYFKL